MLLHSDEQKIMGLTQAFEKFVSKETENFQMKW